MPFASENLSPANPPVKLGHRFINKLGMTFGRLTVIELFDIIDDGVRWRCKCQCGKTVVIRTGALGRTKSCGCIAADSIRRISFRHGDACDDKRTPEYKTWDGIKFRCNNPRCRMYKHYGGRGIKVCERWLHSFSNFLEDMGRKPTRMHSIERINNDGDYEPGNCKWASNIEQQNNRRNNVRIAFRGRTQNSAQWATELGFHRDVLHYRLKSGWTIDEALTTPITASKQRFKKTPRKE